MMALYTLGTFGQHIANNVKNNAYNIFKSLMEFFAGAFNKNNFNDETIQFDYQGYICLSLDLFLSNKNCKEKDARNLFNYVIKSFEQKKEIYKEGISLVASIASFLEGEFSSKMKIFNPYLL